MVLRIAAYAGDSGGGKKKLYITFTFCYAVYRSPLHLLPLSTRLRLLQDLSGLTQTELARRLDVSFVTLNRWANGRATPRHAALARIDRLLQEYLGTTAVIEDPLTAKKAALRHRAQTSPNMLKTILRHQDILDEFVLRLTYTSNRIEGSTLTEAETAAVLFDGSAVPRRALSDQIAAKNHQAALMALFLHLDLKGGIDEALVLRLHGMLMNGLQEDAGRYRRHGVRIVGANIPTANFLSVPQKTADLISDFQQRRDDAIRQAAEVHARFEQIHPFSDGNGRVGRLLLHAMLFRENLPPAVIRPERKRLYYAALNEAQRGGGTVRLEALFCDGILEGSRIMGRE